MPIRDLTDKYRPQRVGKIHLGVKARKPGKSKDEFIEYPTEVDYFVLRDAPELVPIYGEKPKELHITLPSARFERENFDIYLDKVFPQWLKRYGRAGLYCKGDGRIAVCLDPETGAMKEQECPCSYLESGDCKRMGLLRIRIQEFPTLGTYQIATSSFNSIININSFIRDIVELTIVNRIDVSSVKLVLRRGEQDVQRLEKGELKKSRHYIMTMDLDPRFYKTLDDVPLKALPQSMARPLALPPPDETPDDLFYPPKGGENEVASPPGSPSNEQTSAPLLKQQEAANAALKAACDAFRKAGGRYTPKEEDRLLRIDALTGKERVVAFELAADYFAAKADYLKKKAKA